jgi:drug/metabolite transporter (DMT)-like permease
MRKTAPAIAPAPARAGLGTPDDDHLAVRQNRLRRERRALWIAVLCVAVWGLNFPLQKAIFAQTGPVAFLALRYLIVPVCCVLLLCWRFGWRIDQQWPRLPRKDAVWLLGLALLGQGVHVALAAIGLAGSTAFSASVLLACGPAFTLVIVAITGLEKPGRWQVVGLSLAALGVLAFTGEKLLAADWRAGAGDGVLLVAALLFSIYSVYGQSFVQRHGAIVLLAYGGLVCTLPMLLFAAPSLWALPLQSLPGWLWPAVVWSVVGGSFLAWLGWSHASDVRGVARTAPIIYLSPVLAGLTAWLVWGEPQSGAKLAAAAVVLAGVALAQFGRPRG